LYLLFTGIVHRCGPSIALPPSRVVTPNHLGQPSMQIQRLFTREGQDAFVGISFVPRTSRIVNPNGSVVFEMKDLLAPEGWSQVAVDVLAQKYFRKAGVPLQSRRVAEEGVPEWLQRSVPVEEDPRSGVENDARQVFRR